VLTLVAAGRVDVRRDTADEGGSSTEALPAAHLGLEIALSSEVSLAAHGGILARPPSFLELLGDGGATEAAPGLRSERALAFDAGVRAGSPRDAHAGLLYSLEIVGFGSRTRDLILVSPRGLGTLRAENVGDAAAFGGEAALGLAYGPMRFASSYTLLVTRDLTDVVASAGKPLPGRPTHDLTLDLSGRLGRVTLRYGLDVVSSTSLNRESTLTLPTRSWHGASVIAEVSRGLELRGEIANIFDQRTGEVTYESGPPLRTVRYPYGDFVGYPIPGRRWTISVRGTL
jgi:outer membrane cobalamin receptor